MFRALMSLLIAYLTLLTVAVAGVTRIEITSRKPYAEGRVFGDRGQYEVLRGTVFFSLDPKHEANRAVVDLDLVPTTATGKVEFSADIEFLAPVDRSKANGCLFYEVNNRGRKTAPNMFDGNGGDEFLARQGYVVVWSGWIAEVTPDGSLLRLNAPVPLDNGKPLRGLVRNEFIVDKPAEKANVTHRGNQGAYRPAKDREADAKLYRRVQERETREMVPRDQWEFVATDVPGAQLPVVELKLKGGVQPGVIYEVVYEAEGSVVQGTGLTSIRDVVSFLKHDYTAGNPLAINGHSAVNRAVGFGTSQSGRCLRHLLYDGFNADEQGRIALDGVISHVAGGGLGFFNHRFASPTRTNGQHEEHLFPADYFPFTYGEERDPYTGQLDGILTKPRATKTVPKVMHTQSSSEYWHRAGSLVHTDPLGRRDAEIPTEVRIYTFGGTQHGAGTGLPAPRSSGQLPSNPADYRPLLRGLLTAIDAWITQGTEPPASVYPKISDNTLSGWQEKESGWNTIPGVNYPAVIHEPPLLDRGPDWATKRIATIEPPQIKDLYGVRVPAIGPDNNERGCLNIPAVAVPVASYTSWNMRHASVGAEGELVGLQGGYIPLPRAKTERESSGDPRQSLEERYRNYATYQKQFTAAAEKLVRDRYMLAEDLPRQAEFCEKMKELFTSQQ
jgi:hypothetical protein